MGEAERIATGTEEPFQEPLTRSLLAGWIKSDDEFVSITSKCHRTAGVKVWYHSADGTAHLVCAKCKAGVVRLQIAHEVPS